MSVEIGAMLRESRMRARLDIADVESTTKIRAKYLRALENEEWGLLPGPTYVKSFLRTYAEMLELDGRMLVEEFKLRHERPSEIDMQPIRATGAGRAARRTPAPPRLPPWAIAVAVVALLVVVLALLGGGSSTKNAAVPPSNRVVPAGGTAAGLAPGRRRAPKPARVSIRITPTAPVYVCLLGDGRKIINGQILSPGAPVAAHRAKHFQLTLGNGSVRLTIGGRRVVVPQSNNGIGYDFTRRGHRVLPLGKRPTCA
ncbi:MAG: hypothetical protein NVSMB51_20880 [Solirubrobacteraceae bacterium]